MQWTPGGVSGDIEDRRNSGSGFGFGGGMGRVPLGLGGTLILLILSVIFGQDFLSLFSGAPVSTTRSDPARDAGEQRQVEFVSFVLDDAQRTWDKVLASSRTPYRHAKLVLFRDAIQSGCGFAEAATGPFYCPTDEKVYIDLGFFDELRARFGAPGEFAQAYVLAHEIGHHVQKVLGIERSMRYLQRQNPGAANQVSVRMELQADCLAGVWGNSTAQREIIDQADVSAGLRAAAAVGDDRLQRNATGRVSPESFTHGSSAQRTEAFRQGLQSGDSAACQAFTGQ